MKIIIIGGGVIGVSSAYELQKAGHQVLLLEAGEDVGRATSFANGGLLTPSMSDPWNAPGVWRDLLRYLGQPAAPMLVRVGALPSLAVWGTRFLYYSAEARFHKALRTNTELSLVSMEVMREVCAKERLEFDDNKGGVLKIYRDPIALRKGVEKMNRVADLGVVTCLLSKEETLQKEPALVPIGKQLAGALYFPQDWSGDAAAFTKLLAARIQARDGKILCGETVRKIHVEEGRVREVITENVSFTAEAVVIAAGSWSGRLLKPFWRGLPVRPVKGYSLTFEGDRGVGAGLPRIPVVDDDLHAAVTPLGNRLRVAGTAEFAGFDPRLRQDRLNNLKTLLKGVLPAVAHDLLAGPVGAWCGFRPVSADGMPFIGETPIDGLYLNTGHGPFGWTMAMGSARLLTQLISGMPPAMGMAAISPLRHWQKRAD
ncbi:FAD-dependent oxidoreductase [Luteithermobacter gelatinilyticus]|uniref:FAD-dependent oxidoreductase n=1 Tax=Luteithermobacter gelatinilyticus TaxID=2582913 RepID=UPI001107321F|nr:FAD-dependent oxidoreductase [Luteithermobacter gelatinilyticus]